MISDKKLLPKTLMLRFEKRPWEDAYRGLAYGDGNPSPYFETGGETAFADMSEILKTYGYKWLPPSNGVWVRG